MSAGMNERALRISACDRPEPPCLYAFTGAPRPTLRDVSRMLDHPDGARHLVVWTVLADLASRAEPRNWLLDDWRDRAAAVTGFDPEVVTKTIDWLVGFGVCEPARRGPVALRGVAAFLRECCDRGNYFCRSAEVSVAYRRWCVSRGELAVGGAKLHAAILSLDVQYSRSPRPGGKQARCWIGIRLKSSQSDASGDTVTCGVTL